MTDLSDVNMEGVKPMSSAQELGIGQYLVRIEDTNKKETKEKYDEDGQKLPPNHYLQIDLRVYGGPNDGQVEFVRLNLWNTNPTAVNMAKSERKSIEDAISVISTNSNDWHGKWMILEIVAGSKDPSKLYKNYSAAPQELIAQFAANVPPVPAKPASAPAAQPAQATTSAPSTGLENAPRPPAAAAPAAAPGGLPAWAQKKTA